MNFTVLVVLACSIGGKPCKNVELTFADLPVLVCHREAPMILARWQVEHPGLYVAKWRCEFKMPGKDI